jgi:hypothetical protein
MRWMIVVLTSAIVAVEAWGGKTAQQTLLSQQMTPTCETSFYFPNDMAYWLGGSAGCRNPESQSNGYYGDCQLNRPLTCADGYKQIGTCMGRTMYTAKLNRNDMCAWLPACGEPNSARPICQRDWRHTMTSARKFECCAGRVPLVDCEHSYFPGASNCEIIL